MIRSLLSGLLATLMHEVGLMHNALNTVFSIAKEQNAVRVTAVSMRVGRMSGVVPEALTFAFEALTPGTIAEGAVLQLEKIPVKCYCKDCDQTHTLDDIEYLCPACGGRQIEMRSGQEFELSSMELD